MIDICMFFDVAILYGFLLVLYVLRVQVQVFIEENIFIMCSFAGGFLVGISTAYL